MEKDSFIWLFLCFPLQALFKFLFLISGFSKLIENYLYKLYEKYGLTCTNEFGMINYVFIFGFVCEELERG